ncbi:MAG: hypothetical protein CM1200mP18_15160 [Gammaproteobacteria bacterium]|nr:MAG: hypothetical protein CM1200mP18_15160 [Gammaproteobacteria bacterium]
MWHAMVVNIVAVGGKVDVLAGDWHPQRIVMLKFPSREAYEAFIADPDYRALEGTPGVTYHH